MNRTLQHAAVLCGALILALLARATWVQYAQSDALAGNPHNLRIKIADFAQPRGDIIVGGKPITGSEETPGADFRFKRVFRDGPMYAPITGYMSQAQGATFLEGVYDEVLTGKDRRLLTSPVDMVTGKRPKGGDIVTTIDPRAQRAAYEGLTKLDAKGAVVALDPRSGRILAMASAPSYDPSVFAGISSAEGKEFTRLVEDKRKPLSNRAIRETYPPGSSFKILTAAAALEHGVITDVDAPSGLDARYKLPLSTTRVKNDVPDSLCEKASMRTAMQWSCNNVFLDAAYRLGADRMRETAEKFGFNEEQFIPVRTAASNYPAELDDPQTALTGIGQGSLTSTPLQMAMVTAGLANNGKVMKPYLVDEVRAADLSTIERSEPELLSQAVSAKTAKTVQELMELTVSDGSARKAAIDGVTVGGKTSTAQHGVDVRDKRPYAWFVSYAKAPDGSSPVAVAVFVDPEDMDVDRADIAGGRLGAPIAKDVMQAVLDR